MYSAYAPSGMQTRHTLNVVHYLRKPLHRIENSDEINK